MTLATEATLKTLAALADGTQKTPLFKTLGGFLKAVFTGKALQAFQTPQYLKLLGNTQFTTFSVAATIGLNALVRPLFICLDPLTDRNEKLHTSIREVMDAGVALISELTLAGLVFPRAAFWVAKQVSASIKKDVGTMSYKTYKHLADRHLATHLVASTLKNTPQREAFIAQQLAKVGKTLPETASHLLHGATVGGEVLGSILAMSVAAPLIGNYVINHWYNPGQKKPPSAPNPLNNPPAPYGPTPIQKPLQTASNLKPGIYSPYPPLPQSPLRPF